jgi:hypothetical protein
MGTECKCPECGESAYIGFNSVECTNRKCKHYKVVQKVVCPCCGKEDCKDDHTSDAETESEPEVDVNSDTTEIDAVDDD